MAKPYFTRRRRISLKKDGYFRNRLFSGSPCWTRTNDLRINSPSLYRLSLRGIFVLALPIFPGSRPPSIVGADVLNFCVRDGNRWTHIAINTNSVGWVLPILYIKSLATSNSLMIIAPKSQFVKRFFGDPYRIRTDVNGVRGRCLNHLTNGPLVQLQGLEPGTH